MVIPIGAALLFILGVGPALPWGTARQRIRRSARAAAAAHRRGDRRSPSASRSAWRSPWTADHAGVLAVTPAQVTLGQMWLPVVQRIRRGDSAGTRDSSTRKLRRGRRPLRFRISSTPARSSSIVAHRGCSSTMRTQQEIRVGQGPEHETSAAIRFTFTGNRGAEASRIGPSTLANFIVTKNGQEHRQSLAAHESVHRDARSARKRPDVHTTITGDIYLSIMKHRRRPSSA